MSLFKRSARSGRHQTVRVGKADIQRHPLIRNQENNL